MERSNIVNHPRRRKLVAASAVSTALLASFILTGCSNPYSTQEVNPDTITATSDTYIPRLPVTAPSTDDLVPSEDTQSTSDFHAQPDYFNIVPSSVLVPQTITDKFGDSAETIANDALYSFWIAGTMTDYQKRPMVVEEQPLLIAGLHEIFSTSGEAKFKDELANSSNDDAKYLSAFQILPFIMSQDIQVGETSYTIDNAKIWNAVYWNAKIDEAAIIDSGTIDGIKFNINRSLYIPTTSGDTLRIDEGISLHMILDVNGRWVIDDWTFNQSPAELEK